MAEGILKDLLIDEAERSHSQVPVKVISAGTHACDGCHATDNAIAVSSEAGINLTHHISRVLTTGMVENADLILTMEQNHRDFIHRNWPGVSSVYELKRFSVESEMMPKVLDIKDPIGGTLAIYRDTLKEIRKEIIRIAPVIIEQAKNRKQVK